MKELRWTLVPANPSEPEPDDIIAGLLAMQNCPGHQWVLDLEDCNVVSLHCQRCPADVDYLYPDGHDLIYFYSQDDSIVVEAGSHNLPDEQTPVSILVDARILSGQNYWGEWDVELIIEARGSDERASKASGPVGDGS